MSVALPIRVPDWLAGKRFVHFQGTSMSAPFMAGVIALMLDKNPNLSTADIISKLAARPGAKPASPPAAHQNAYGIGMIDGLKSHLNAP
jgi:subtilisin family serine protease